MQVNQAWEEFTGYAESEVCGLECRPHGPTRPGDLAGLGGSFCPPPEAMAGRPAGGPTTIIRRGGERIDRRVEFWPLHSTGGILSGLLGFVLEVGVPPRLADADSQSLRYALLDLRGRMFARHALDTLIGLGPEHRRILDGIEAAAATTVPVTITGESGTGKRFVARLIHGRGPRRQMPLLGYDCRAVPPAVLERELFAGPGPESGSLGDRLVAPDGATVVVGDLLDLPRDLQARLASALMDPDRPARLIVTTVGDFDEAHRREQIRPDLYHAVTSLVIRLRPLRDRPDDLPLLAQSLLERANLRGEVTRSGFEPAAIAVLAAYDWPGNLRELAEVVESTHRSARGDLITEDDLPPRIRGQRGAAYLPTHHPATDPTPKPTLKDRLLAFERRAIEEALAQAQQNKSRAARLLGVNRPFLYRRMKELAIADPESNPPIARAIGAAAPKPAGPTASGT